MSDELREMSGHGLSTLTKDDTMELEALLNEVDNPTPAPTPEPVAAEEPAIEEAPAVDPEVPVSDPVEPVADPVAGAPVEPSQEDPLETEYPTPKHLNAEKRSSWKDLRQIASNASKESKALKDKYEEAVTALAEFEKGSQLPSTVKTELDDLRQFRRMVDLSSDPEFTKQFDDKIMSEEHKVYSRLMELGLKEEAIKEIINSNGILGRSKDEWGRLIFGALRGEEFEFTRAELKDSINKIFEIGREKQDQLKQASTNYEQFYKQRQQSVTDRETTDHNNIVDEVAKIQKEIPWANEPKRPSVTTPEATIKYQREMKQWDDNTKRFHLYLNPPDSRTRAQAALAATGYFKVSDDNKALTNENTLLRQQIAKLQNVGKTNTVRTPVVKAAPKKDRLDMDDNSALEDLMKEMGL